MTLRLKPKLWIEAHVRQCFAKGTPAFVIQKGDHERGSILIKINRFASGVSLIEQARDFDGNLIWRQIGDIGLSEEDVDAKILKRRQFDGDLWVIEVEDIDNIYDLGEPIEQL